MENFLKLCCRKKKINSITPQNVQCLSFMSGESQLTAVSHAPPMAASFSSLVFTFIFARARLFILFTCVT